MPAFYDNFPKKIEEAVMIWFVIDVYFFLICVTFG